MKYYTKIFLLLFGIISVQLSAQTLSIEEIDRYSDDAFSKNKKGEILWDATIEQFAHNNFYTINQDSTISHIYEIAFPELDKNILFDFLLDSYRTDFYSSIPNQCYYQSIDKNDTILVKESEILRVDKNYGVIRFSYRSPNCMAKILGIQAPYLSSLTYITWAVSDGLLKVEENIRKLDLSYCPTKEKEYLRPNEIFPFGYYSTRMQYNTNDRVIKRMTSKGVLASYIFNKKLYSKIENRYIAKTSCSRLNYNNRFLIQSSGNCKTNDNKNYCVEYFEGKSAHELFSKFKTAITLLYKSSKDNISFVDDEVISINAYSKKDFYWKENYTLNMNYVIKFMFKDGRVRVEAPTILSLFPEESFSETCKKMNIFVTEEPFEIDMINSINYWINDIIDKNVAQVRALISDDDW